MPDSIRMNPSKSPADSRSNSCIRVKAVCPLCKQPFRSIIHNIRALDDYDEFTLRPTDSATWASPDGRRFRYRSTLVAGGRRDLTLTRDERERNALQRRHRHVLSLSRGAWHRRHHQGATSEDRRRVYAEGLQLRVARDAGTRYRETGPQFYRENPACTHRLVPWLNRELNLLLAPSVARATYVLELVLSLLLRHEVLSGRMHERLYPHLRRNTRRFLWELHNFARSPHDMVAYDRAATYVAAAAGEGAPPTQASDVVLLSPDSRASPPGGETRYGTLLTTHNPEPPAGGAAARLTGSIQGDYVTNMTTFNPLPPTVSTGMPSTFGISGLPTGSTAPSISEHLRRVNVDFDASTRLITRVRSFLARPDDTTDTSDEDVVVLPARGRHASPAPVVDLSPASSRDSDVVVITELKPLHERTPPLVAITDDDDNDAASSSGADGDSSRSRGSPSRWRDSPARSSAQDCRSTSADRVSAVDRSSRPSVTNAYSSGPSIADAYSSRPSITDAYSSRPSIADAYSSRPSITDAYSSRPSITDAYSSRPSITDAYSLQPRITDTYSSWPGPSTADAHSSRPAPSIANAPSSRRRPASVVVVNSPLSHASSTRDSSWEAASPRQRQSSRSADRQRSGERRHHAKKRKRRCGDGSPSSEYSATRCTVDEREEVISERSQRRHKHKHKHSRRYRHTHRHSRIDGGTADREVDSDRHHRRHRHHHEHSSIDDVTADREVDSDRHHRIHRHSSIDGWTANREVDSDGHRHRHRHRHRHKHSSIDNGTTDHEVDSDRHHHRHSSIDGWTADHEVDSDRHNHRHTHTQRKHKKN
ncbi:PREDICTED: E3 ubiquitin-protein ligase Topors-like [Priapulus caudatus]|uniref:RING-type E3 ubiquitin transferase n=1 Tax=Priapulus caudatus TaxID=37621 RepID=A0ABM1EHH4_PRICU|nr:PREDICTED: E3 ubiquitin-protein ligase Topors-like [Priapulus caudatus]